MYFLLFDTQSELAKSQEIRYKSYKVADELRQSSDDLTRFARTYVITGNKMYEDFSGKFWRSATEKNPGRKITKGFIGILFWIEDSPQTLF